jgi:hypothetical protein
MEVTLRTVNEVPPPAYFVRSVPLLPTGKWMRAKVASQGPLVAGLVLALAAGTGMGLGLSPSCTLTAPLSNHPGSEPGPLDHPGSGLTYVVQWQPVAPRLTRGNP